MFKACVKCNALGILANWIEILKIYIILLLWGTVHGGWGWIREEGSMHLIFSIFFMVLLLSLLFTTYGWVVCAIVDRKSSMNVHMFANKRGRRGRRGGREHHQCQHSFVNQKQPLHRFGTFITVGSIYQHAICFIYTCKQLYGYILLSRVLQDQSEACLDDHVGTKFWLG